MTNEPRSKRKGSTGRTDGRTRWLIDLRQLNYVTIHDAYPLQENLNGAKIFTLIDACGAFHFQIEKLLGTVSSFYQSFGTFHYICMPFGLSNAGSVYSQMLDLALTHLPADYWLLYLDDILMYSKDTWAHLEHLRKALQAHMKAKIKIQPKKTKIFLAITEYLGHKLSKEDV